MKQIIGFTNVYYTLWRYETESNEHYELTKYYYVKNVSKDLDKVKQLYPDLEIDTELKGHSYFEVKNEIKKETYHKDYKIEFGKYRGLSMEQIFIDDPDYLVWLYKETYSAIILQVLNDYDEFQNYIKIKKQKEDNKFKNSFQFKEGEEIELNINFKSNLKVVNYSLYGDDGIYTGKPVWADYDDNMEDIPEDEKYAYYYIENYKDDLDLELKFKKNDVKLYLYKGYVYALPLNSIGKGIRIKNKEFIVKGKIIFTDLITTIKVKKQILEVSEIKNIRN